VTTEMLTPLTEAPPPRSGWHDFRLLLANQLRVTWNKIRHWSPAGWLGVIILAASTMGLLIYLGEVAYGALETMPPQIARGFLSLLFMMGLAGQLFFGVTAAFTTLYMSEDLELLFMAPVSARVVFAVKSLVVAAGNFIPAVLFILLPGVFYGLLFGLSAAHYLLTVLVCLGMLAIGVALAELLNLAVMRIVPPHRSREAVGFIAALGGIMLVLVFQLPNLLMSNSNQLDIARWLSGQQKMLQAMDYFPWGWGSLALAEGACGNLGVALGWSLLLLALAAVIYMLAFTLVERGFRRGWVSLGQGGGGRRQKRKPERLIPARRLQAEKSSLFEIGPETTAAPSCWGGLWAVAKKDLLCLRRDSREWFGIITPLIIMAFFIAQFLLAPGGATRSTMVTVVVLYSIMFSGNMALQSFGREGEADWVMNSVPMAGWPVVWGKLLAAVLPTLFLIEALLVGTALTTGIPLPLTAGLAVGAVFLSLGASSIGLYFSINYCRFNPDSPHQRTSGGIGMVMGLINLVFMLLLGIGLAYVFTPVELLLPLLVEFSPPFEGGIAGLLLWVLYLLTRPMLWPDLIKTGFGVVIAGGVWAAVFFGFMAATVRQSRKGFSVEIITSSRKKLRLNPLLKR